MRAIFKTLAVSAMIGGLLVSLIVYLNSAPDYLREQLRDSRLCEINIIPPDLQEYV